MVTVATGWSYSWLLTPSSRLLLSFPLAPEAQDWSLLGFCRDCISLDSAEDCTGKLVGKRRLPFFSPMPCMGALKERGCLLALGFSKINWQLLEVRKPNLAWDRKL